MSRAGVVLLEVLLAVTILSTAGITAVSIVASMLGAEADLELREIELVAAERELIATSLLTRRELEQRIGRREVTGFVVWIDRAEPSLFRIGISPTERPAAELLATLVYRPR